MPDSPGPFPESLQSERHRQVMNELTAIKIQLEKLNGRTRDNEIAIAILRDRSPGRVGTVAGSIAGALAGALASYFSYLNK